MTAVSTAPVGAGVRAGITGRTARRLAGITAVGLLLGLVVGGVGGRLAMRALFLTSDPSVRGLTSDDGFAIGQFSPQATMILLFLATGIGVVGAFVYVAVRPFLMGPPWMRMIGCTIGGGAVVGAMVVHTEGVDFTVLSPRGLAIALFVAIPAVFAALCVPLAEGALREDSWFQRAPAPLALLPLAVFAFPPLLVMIGVPVALVLSVGALLQRSPRAVAMAAQPAAIWTVRAVLVSVAAGGVIALVRDAVALL
jgi:hypothetical protein